MNELVGLNETFFSIVKAGIILLLFIYLIFTIVVVRQTKIMTETLKVGFEVPIKTLSLIQVLMVVLLLILAIIIL